VDHSEQDWRASIFISIALVQKMNQPQVRIRIERLRDLLRLYNIGTLRNIRVIQEEVSDETKAWVYLISTSQGKYFIKYYRKMSAISRKGIELIDFLARKKYPVPRVVKSRAKKTITAWRGVRAVVYKSIEGKAKNQPNSKEAYEVGRQLARLHTLAKSFPLRKSFEGYDDITKLFEKNIRSFENIPERVRGAVLYLRKIKARLDFSKQAPISICHGEFWWEHLYFKKEKLIAVIDWDTVSRDVMLYDLGCAMNLAHGDGFDIEIIGGIVSGYNSIRPLTDWEKEHLFHALSWGAFKAFTWSILPKNIKRRGWPTADLERIEDVQKLGRARFNKAIKAYLQ
jgi:Ser/Thr protein kinase RdoA (MazF antagonist)